MQLNQDEIAEMLELLMTRKVTKRYGRMVGLLNRLSLEFYDLSPIESDELRTFQPGSIMNICVDRDWYLAQVRLRCCHPDSSGEVCANLLNSLDYSEILAIVNLKDFNLDILGYCFSYPPSYAGQTTAQIPKPNSMFNAARDALWQNVKEIVDHLPTPFAIYNPKEHWDPSPNEAKYAHRLFAIEPYRQIARCTCIRY